MLRRIRGLHKNESGQSIVFSAITFLFLALFVFMVLNVGDVTSKKMRLTNNADAVAVSGATWMCRGYNLTAMLNITQTQVLALIILMKSFKRANKIAKVLLQIQARIADILSGIPYTAAIGAALRVITIPQQQLIQNVGERVYENILAKNLENDGNGILWDIEDYLVQAEEIAVKVIPFIAQAEAVKTSLTNGATLGFLYPTIPLVDLKLPFIDDDDRKFESLCKPVADHFNAVSRAVDTKIAKIGDIGMEGQKNIEHMPTTSFMASDKLSDTLGTIMDMLTFGNFGPAPLEYFKAYLFYPLLRAIPPFIGAVYDGVVRATYMTMCTGQPGSYSYKKTTDNCEECKQHADELTKLTYVVNGGITLRQVNSVDEIVQKHDCNCGDPEPCKKVGTILGNNGEEQDVCAYFTGKVQGKDAWLPDVAKNETLEGDRAKNFFKYYLNKRCSRKTVENVRVYPEQYGFEVSENQKDALGRVRAKKIVELKVASCEYQKEESISSEEAWGSRGGSGDDNKPKPYLLNREDDDGKEYWQKHKDYIGIVYLLPEENIINLKKDLKNPNPVGMIYFSQAEIYVPDGVEPHLFNQCWQVRLVRFTKHKELFEKLNSSGVSQAINIGGGSSGKVGKFMQILKSLKEIFTDDVIIH